jgi:hypothetical protein
MRAMAAFAIVMWLDAYYRDEDDPPIIELQQGSCIERHF